jgi:hypothetical protein
VRGLMPFADQLSSPLDSIDPVSGKINLSIPLGSLPAGRGGSGFELALVYDSHIYDQHPYQVIGGELIANNNGVLEKKVAFNDGDDGNNNNPGNAVNPDKLSWYYLYHSNNDHTVITNPDGGVSTYYY